VNVNTLLVFLMSCYLSKERPTKAERNYLELMLSYLLCCLILSYINTCV